MKEGENGKEIARAIREGIRATFLPKPPSPKADVLARHASKAKFASEEAVRDFIRAGYIRLGWYKCDLCDGWHTTRKNRNRKP